MPAAAESDLIEYYMDRISVKHQKYINGMYIFSIDYRQQRNRRAAFASIIEECGPLWKQLAPDKKEQYNKLASKCKSLWVSRGGNVYRDEYGGCAGDTSDVGGGAQIAGVRSGRLDNRNLPIDERSSVNAHLLARDADRGFLSKMVERSSSVADRVFIVMDVVTLLEKEVKDRGYLPAEVTLFFYSIRDGVVREFTEYINPGKVFLGYRALFQEYQEKHFFEENMDIMNSNIGAVFENIRAMCDGTASLMKSAEDRVIPVFVLDVEESRKKVQFTLDFMAQKYRDSTQLNVPYLFRAFPLELLVSVLVQHATGAIVDVGLLRRQMLEQQYDHVEFLSCTFHDEVEARVCSNASVKKSCYRISSVLADKFNVTLTSKHAPISDAISAQQLSEASRQSQPSGITAQSSLATSSSYRSANSTLEYNHESFPPLNNSSITPSYASSAVSSFAQISVQDGGGQGRGRVMEDDMSDVGSTCSSVLVGRGRSRGRGIAASSLASGSTAGDSSSSVTRNRALGRGRGRGHGFGQPAPAQPGLQLDD